MRLVAAEINMGGALGPRQEEKGGKMRKREKAKHAMRSPVSPNQSSLDVMSAVAIFAFFVGFFWHILRYFLVEPRA